MSSLERCSFCGGPCLEGLWSSVFECMVSVCPFCDDKLYELERFVRMPRTRVEAFAEIKQSRMTLAFMGRKGETTVVSIAIDRTAARRCA